MKERLTADQEHLVLGSVTVAKLLLNKSHEIIANKLIERYNAGQDAIQAWRDLAAGGELSAFKKAMDEAQSRAERIF
jgi:uncharacterized protein YbjQ (UPF0145 family)